MKIPGVLLQLFPACLGVCLLPACSPEKVWLNPTENTWYQVKEQQYPGDFVLEQIQVTTHGRRQHTAGISLRFSFGLSTLDRLLLRDETDLGIDSYRLTAQLLNASGKPISNPASAQTLQETVFRIGAYTPPEFFFPYAGFPFPEGEQEVLLLVRGYSQTQGQKPRNAAPSLTLQVAVGFSQPRLYAAQVFVEDFALDEDKADPHGFDFRMAGSGYPDLCWRLFSGAEVLHTGPVAKNQTRYAFASGTRSFIFSETDSVRLQFYDDDELSDHDLLAVWVGRPANLPRQTGQELVFPDLQPTLVKQARVWAAVAPLVR